MADDLGQLALTTGRRHGHPVHMALHVEVLVALPHREVQPQGHPAQLAREGRDLLSPLAELILEPVERVATGHSRGIEQDEATHVHQLLGRLQVEEARVEPTEPVHTALQTRTGSDPSPDLSGYAPPVSYTRRQAVLAALVANAIKPVRGRITVVPVFFASWLTSELAPQILVVQALDTLRALRRREATLTGLALGALSAVGLGWMLRQSSAVADQVDAVLRRTNSTFPKTLIHATPLRTYARPFKYADRGVRVLRDVAYTEGGRRAKLDIYLPAEGAIEKAPVLLQIHGGGWIISHKGQQGLLLMNQMAARGWVCVAANYRLAPKHRWPTQIIDVKRAIAWVRDNIAEYGGDPDYVILTGGSAGAHLRRWPP